ncbi:thioester reductase domain-containing protein [Streptomyces caeruleatus]|uniref:Polyketide synthase n=1 Tax=Streptomyces caeruleatus TaxID=661399 RepID=A0A101U7F6_9ACTN|nr:thioester reductase domain-containing protein [Streptomyces caeruleatus]KUO05623.1 polyketide synthase [Streptomyces caeruleatus]
MREVNENVSAGADQRATGEAIERGGVGLTVSDLLAKVTGSAPPAESAPATQDADELAAAIAAVAGRYVPAGHLSPDADFFDAGGTSVSAVELVSALQDELGVSLDLDEVFADARPVALAKGQPHLRATATAVPEVAGPVETRPTVVAARPDSAPSAAVPERADPVATWTTPQSAVATWTTPPPAVATWTTPPPAVATLTDSAPSTAAPERADPLAARPTRRPAVQTGPRSAAPSTALPETAAPVAPRPVPAPAAAVRPHNPPSAPTARPEDLTQILADLALADRLPFTASPDPVPPRRVLLTGATGFLGSHMLLDLLRHSDAHVHCLVRAADEEAATARLGEALKKYGLPWSSEVRRRVTMLPGDIRRPRLGLSDDLWNTLAHELDSIVGVAAAVDFLRGYQSLRTSNVLGALTLAELAATGRPKPLHHISSIAVFNEVGILSMGEDDPLAHIDRLVAGYDQTKWAAEVALRRARDHGLVVTALRPGGIGGHTRTGAYNAQDLSSGLISAFGRFRTVPAFRYLNAAPVDWVSRVAVAVVCEPDAWGFDYNLTGVPNTLDDVVGDMAFGGMHVRVHDWDEWRVDALARLAADPIPELAFLSRVLQSPTALKLCEATLKGPAATADRTTALVEALGLPPATRYDARAQLKTFERLAGDGLARLPQKDDQPYLWFSENTEGSVSPVAAGPGGTNPGGAISDEAISDEAISDGPIPDGASPDGASPGAATPGTPCPMSMSLTLSIASMHQLVTERRVDVRGEVICPALHPEPLTVARGDIWIRPEEGIPHRHGLRHQLLRCRLELTDPEGGRWWLEGHKYARARRDIWRQTRALTVRLGREGEPARLAGEVVVPADSYVRDQIDGIKVDPRLTSQEKRAAKLTWLAWFGLEMGRGLLGPFARAAADLLDLRRPQTPTEHHR